MKTRLIKQEDITEKIFEEAAELIKQGDLVAFPTETVYGLGANGLDITSYKKVYSAKGRPSDNPLIFHVSSIDMCKELVRDLPKEAEKLMREFWPGPLTLVFNKNNLIDSELTSGLNTIAIRMPNNDIALKLIEKSNVPLVAPSANLSGKPSPTKAQHVFEDLKGSVSIILDGGPTEIGIESTVLDVSKKPFTILRPGRVTYSHLKKIIGNDLRIDSDEKKKNQPKSPGMKYKHYAPNAEVVLISTKQEELNLLENNKKAKILVLSYTSKTQMAKNIFADFRDADNNLFDIVLVYKVSTDGISLAIMNRIKKAALKK